MKVKLFFLLAFFLVLFTKKGDLLARSNILLSIENKPVSIEENILHLINVQQNQNSVQKRTNPKLSLQAKEKKKLELFTKLIIKNKSTISQVVLCYIVNQFLLTYVLKNTEKSVYPFLRRKSAEINNFLQTQEEYLDLADKYFANSKLSISYKYLPLVLKMHENEDKNKYQKKLQREDKPLTIWKITPAFLNTISYGNGKNKETSRDLTVAKATIFMGKYFTDRYGILNQNTYYVIVEYLTRHDEKNRLYDLLKDGKATSVSDIEEYLNVKDRIKIREFLAIYFYDNILKNPDFDFYKDPFIIDVLKKNSLF